MTIKDFKFKTLKARPPVHNFREAEEIAEGWLAWTWRKAKESLKKKGEEQGKPYKPGQEFLQMGVEETEVEVGGKKVKVSLLAIELTEEGKACDVLYESLMRHQNHGKEFTVLQVNDELLVYNEEKQGLWMPRWSFHNLVPIKEKYVLIDFETTRPSNQDIENADEAQYKNYAKIYNEAIGLGSGEESKKDKTIHELDELINAVNSAGEYYEICSEQNYNDYWNALDGEIKKGTKGYEYPSAIDIDNTHMSLADAKGRLKDFIKVVINGLPAKKAEIVRLKGMISAWLKEGNITDRAYNENVKKLKEVADHPTVKAYNDLKVKVMGGDPNYSEHRSKFESESKREVEMPKDLGGAKVKAEQEPTPIKLDEIKEENFYVYEKITSGDLTQDEANAILADKKAKKQEYKNTRNQRKLIASIIERKKQVIKLIEKLVKGEGPTQNIPQLRTQTISDIQDELDKSPPVVDSELGQYSDWKSRINKLNSETEINTLKSTLKSEIEKARTKKESGAKLKKLITEGEGKSNYEELETILKEIYKDFAETPAFQENNDKTRVENLEKRLLGLDTSGNKYSQTVKNDLQAKLNDLGLQEQDLPDETKQNLKNIRENTISDKQTLPHIKIKALEDIGKTDAKKKMQTLQSEVQTALDSKDQSKIDTAKTKVNDFISKGGNNFYYQEKVSEAQALLTRLENYQQGDHSNNNSDGFPWKIVVPIFLAAVVVGIILVMVWRKKNQAEEEE